MFELEGTRHEKVALVLLAYIIGITSGYIAFATHSTPVSAKYQSATFHIDRVSDMNSHIPIDNSDYGRGIVQRDKNHSDRFVHYTDGRLIVESPDLQMLISIHADQMGEDVQPGFEMQGTHIVPPVFIADAADENVFFCEFFKTDAECLSYIFNATDVTIKPVVLNGQQLNLTETEARTAAWVDGQLMVANLVSLPREPWKLTIR